MRGWKGRTGAAHPSWKGGRVIDRDGYVRIWVPQHPWPRRGYVPEHVVVMELYLQRRIAPSECVHHKDGNRQNNALDNLEVLPRSQHSKEHRMKDAATFARGANGQFTRK